MEVEKKESTDLSSLLPLGEGPGMSAYLVDLRTSISRRNDFAPQAKSSLLKLS
jgi:hypothetical protein